MQSLGLPDEDIKLFCADNLFLSLNKSYKYIKTRIFMAEPSTRETLKQYSLRALGKPVIEINVDDDLN